MILIKTLLAFLIAVPIIWGFFNWFRYKEHPVPRGTANYTTLINSAVLYALAFNLIFFFQELFLVLGKKAIGLRSFLYHNNHTYEGDHALSPLMQGSGALAIFLIGLICLVIYRLIPYSKSVWKLLVLWLSFQGLIQSIPQVMIAYLAPDTDVGQALIGYLKLSEPTMIVLSALSILATAMLSIWFSKPLLTFVGKDVDLNNPRAKLRYMQFIAVGAAFLGSIFIVPFRIPPPGQAIAPFLVFLVSIPWVWSAATLSKTLSKNSSSINEKVYWVPILSLVILLFLFRLVLAPGVEF
jgi:hypothetical protein